MAVGGGTEIRRTVVPLAIGVVAMLTALPDAAWLVVAAALVGPFVAGALNPDEPVRAGVLVVVPPIVGGLVRVVADRPSAVGAFLFAAVSAAAVALVLSHVGAGVQRRRAAGSV